MQKLVVATVLTVWALGSTFAAAQCPQYLGASVTPDNAFGVAAAGSYA